MPNDKLYLTQNLYVIFLFLAASQMLDVADILSREIALEGVVLFKLACNCFIALFCSYKAYRVGDSFVNTPPTQGPDDSGLKRAPDSLEATLPAAPMKRKEKAP